MAAKASRHDSRDRTSNCPAGKRSAQGAASAVKERRAVARWICAFGAGRRLDGPQRLEGRRISYRAALGGPFDARRRSASPRPAGALKNPPAAGWAYSLLCFCAFVPSAPRSLFPGGRTASPFPRPFRGINKRARSALVAVELPGQLKFFRLLLRSYLFFLVYRAKQPL